jgi:copper(I)-binding protein
MRQNRSGGGLAWRSWTSVVLLFAMGALAAQAQAPELIVKNAWARMPLAPQNNSAVYMMLENPSTTTRSVVSVATADADKAELHEMRTEGSMMTMTPAKEVRVPAKGSVEFKPGGFHIMLFRVKKPVKAGDHLNLVLKLSDGASVPVVATVRPADDGPATPAAGHSMPGM